MILTKTEFFTTFLLVWYCAYFTAEINVLQGMGVSPDTYYNELIEENAYVGKLGKLRILLTMCWMMLILPKLWREILA